MGGQNGIEFSITNGGNGGLALILPLSSQVCMD